MLGVTLSLVEFLDQAIIGEVRKLAHLRRIIVHESKPDVGLVEDPDRQRVPIGDEHPLPDIEFLLIYY